MISNKATPLTEFRISNKTFDPTQLVVSKCENIDDVTLIKNVLSVKECDLIATSIFNVLDSKEFIKNGTRIHKNAPEFGNIIYERIQKHCVSQLTRKNPTNSNENLNWKVDSVSDKFRFIRYNEGEEFPNHTDGEAKPNNEKMSFFSVLIFTNDCGKDFEGGEFRFFKKNYIKNQDGTSCGQLEEIASVRPEKGLCLIFPHSHIHDSVTISKGTKQTIRSDLVYQLCAL